MEKEIDVFSLPSRNERGYEEIEQELIEKERNPLSRTEMKKEQEEKKRTVRRRLRLTKILLCLFIPIPIAFVLFVFQPDWFRFLTERNEPRTNFETVQIVGGGNREVNVQAPVSDNHSGGNETEYILHTVEEGETLFTISQEHFGNRDGEAVIRELNGLTSSEVEVGQVLKIRPIEE